MPAGTTEMPEILVSLWWEEVVVRASHKARRLCPAGSRSGSLSAIDPSALSEEPPRSSMEC